MAGYYKLDLSVEGERVASVAFTRDPATGSMADLPGVYCLRTNLMDWDAERLWKTYVTLTDIEAVFRCLKSELGLRPIHHRVPRRTEGHLFDEEFDLSDEGSYLAHLDGSGATTIRAYARKWRGTSAEGTSRAAFWAFCDALYSEKDGFSGGAPQLVGIWRKGAARQFGLLWCGKRYLCGVEVPADARFDSVDWFNQRFERIDGEKIKRVEDGKRHPKPPL